MLNIWRTGSVSCRVWSKLYSTRSLPFDAPKKSKVAVKVINHYGDEVLKVFRIS